MTPNGILAQEATEQRIWYGCYDGNWVNIATDESMSHPAKFSRFLISRIYSYMLEQGYLKSGDAVLDPFGGVGLGALYAVANGLNWIGCELEKRFHDMGQGCDCTGISPEEWREHSEEFKADTIGQLNYKDNRHWCPACIAGAIQIKANGLNGHRQPGLFDTAEDSRLPVGFKLAEDGTPYSPAHHYAGNLELFRKYAQPGTWAVLLNGDSRRLRAVIGQAQVDGVLSSPPYSGSRIAQDNGNDNLANFGRNTSKGRYGGTSGQLGAMSEGNLDGAISSPPYANSVNQSAGANDTEARIKRMEKAGIDVTNRANVGGGNGVARRPQTYGDSDGQLGAMREGELSGIVSSPPFAGNTGGRGEASRNGIDAALFDRHSGGMKRGTGDSPDNLDHLPMKGFGEALVSSPPYVNVDPAKSGSGINLQKNYETYRASGGGQSFEAYCRTQAAHSQGYGNSNGQLSGLPSGSFDAALSSPPFADSVGSDDPDKRGGLFRDERRRNDRNLTGSYGTSEGQLGVMPAGDGLVSSPPFEKGSEGVMRASKFRDPVAFARAQMDKGHGCSFEAKIKAMEADNNRAHYGATTGQLGTEQGQTFWAAAKAIVTESYLALKPGAYSAWVCKAFVRSGQRVDFPDQWRQLCEACGFEYVETVRAMLVSPEEWQGDLGGGDKKIQKSRKSFFRRLHEKRAPHLAIDFEEVVILRKPGE